MSVRTRATSDWIFTRVHLMLAIVLGVLLPAASWLLPGVGPAWAMYTTTAVFRLRIDVVDRNGHAHAYPTQRLADRLAPNAFDVIVGAEQWKHAPTFTMADHLDGIARAVCADRGVRSVHIQFAVRSTLASPESPRALDTECP